MDSHPDADSLYVEKIDCGDADGPRTVVSGLAKFMTKEELLGKSVLVVCNLKPATMRGIQSSGMLLAASKTDPNGSEVVEVVTAPDGARAGEFIQVDGFQPAMPDALLKSKTAQDCFKRVMQSLKVDSNCNAVYTSNGISCKLMTSMGPCRVNTLAESIIR